MNMCIKYEGMSMKNVLIWVIIVCGGVGSAVQAATQANQLQELYYSKNDHKNCLEIASVLLLFTCKPQAAAFKPPHKVLPDGMHQIMFTFDNASAGHNLLKRVKECVGDGYTIALNAQDKNLVLVVIYDPKKIEVKHGSYTDLDMRKGFIIRFFDRALLTHINNKESYILQTASMGMCNSTRPMRLLV